MKYLVLLAFLVAMPLLPGILNRLSQKSQRESERAAKIEEALKILEVPATASDEEIRAAHKRLIQKNHPDSGGSEFLASKINEARDILLGTLKKN